MLINNLTFSALEIKARMWEKDKNMNIFIFQLWLPHTSMATVNTQ